MVMRKIKPGQMRILRDPRSDIQIIDGRFYMVQRADVANNRFHWRGYVTDRRGNPRVVWPGRSIWRTREEAEDVARRLALRHPDYPFIVMEAIVAYGATKMPYGVVRRSLR